MDDHIQEVMLRCIRKPSITAVGPIVTGNDLKAKKKKKKKTTEPLDHEI